jgi:hypothetical protein
MARYNKNLKGTFDAWADIDLKEVEIRDETWVVKMDGWKQSIGVTEEIKYALSLNKPVYFIDPRTLKKTHYREDVK